MAIDCTGAHCPPEVILSVGSHREPATRGGSPPAPAPRVGQGAAGCPRAPRARRRALWVPGGRYIRRNHGLAPPGAPRPSHRVTRPEAGPRPARGTRHAHAGRERRQGSGQPKLPRGPRPPRRSRQGPALHHIVEPAPRGGKRVPRPLVGLQAWEAAQDPLVGLALMPRIRNTPRGRAARAEGLTAAARFYALAASSPHRQGPSLLHDHLSKICDRALFFVPHFQSCKPLQGRIGLCRQALARRSAHGHTHH